jgi:hypothetical protein
MTQQSKTWEQIRNEMEERLRNEPRYMEDRFLHWANQFENTARVVIGSQADKDLMRKYRKLLMWLEDNRLLQDF